MEFVKHWAIRQEVVDGLFKVYRETAERKQIEYDCAVRIQCWFRGLRVRAYLKTLNDAAVVIQKNFRGYLARKCFRARIKECLEEMRINYYHKNATCIQRYWRGYYVRKYIHNYYALKAYLEGLVVKNAVVLEQLKSHEELINEEERTRLQKLEKLNFEREVIEKHYMMSTQSMAGVFNPPHKKNPDPLETAMHQLRVNVKAMKESRTTISSKTNTTQILLSDREVNYSAATSLSTRDPQRLIALGESCISPALILAASNDKCYNVLPPIPSKVQGPFKKPEEVIRQKFRPLQPTLRVATAYDSVETARAEVKAMEWRQRLHDNKFLPFSKQTYTLQPTVNSESPYEKLAYGNQHFRDTDSTKNIAKVDFQTTLPPIPIFEKLNTTY